ncbi:P26-2 [Perigonia lusca single nucleopolyhedrovirus]|uniref:p26-2 n=1 Tax=Perigonia lusca single nucleopolyhedrovirus TaxID=1675865 RepID=A0A0M3N126_9ABAC|nr:P26-2 [Perigonia lusca single nucleopolyhedrovirus]AKN80643.1 P26-2 [Perigonia lusca single nucleopolyhedrovirus]
MASNTIQRLGENQYKVRDCVFCVDYNFRRIQTISYKDKPVTNHVFIQHNSDPGLQQYHHYPNLATTLSLPKLHTESLVEVIMVNYNGSGDDKTIMLNEIKLSKRLYFVHHHYGKYYRYGQVPAIVLPAENKNRSTLFVGAPIFQNDNIVSFITDCYLNTEQSVYIMPVTGPSYRVDGVLTIDGIVRVIKKEDYTTIKLPTVSRIDVHVVYDKKTVTINTVYEGVILSFMLITAVFAGNLLII